MFGTPFSIGNQNKVLQKLDISDLSHVQKLQMIAMLIVF